MIYVTGHGVVSSIGDNTEETFASLLASKTGIKPGVNAYSQNYKVGEVLYSNEELKERFFLKCSGSRTSLLGLVAARESFQGHELLTGLRTGLISGTSVGGMDISDKAYRNYLDNTPFEIQSFRNHPSGTSTEQIAFELGISHFVNTISTACSSAANAIMMGARMINGGLLDRVVVGGTDSLTQFTIAGFRSLMIFDENWCRPFDETRNGLNLGEGAGYLVLESERSIERTKKNPIAILSGWGNASDAFHQTASSPNGDGAVLAMTQALKNANLSPADIDYINAHGTATPNNDLTESKAILSVFGEKVPPFSSTKSFTGHTLAASGGIEAVISILAIKNKCVFPNLNHSQVISETGLKPVTSNVQVNELRHVLSNSFGFGGNNSTLILSSIKP